MSIFKEGDFIWFMRKGVATSAPVLVSFESGNFLRLRDVGDLEDNKKKLGDFWKNINLKNPKKTYYMTKEGSVSEDEAFGSLEDLLKNQK